jgi:hypothetical protein
MCVGGRAEGLLLLVTVKCWLCLLYWTREGTARIVPERHKIIKRGGLGVGKGRIRRNKKILLAYI